MYPPPGEPVSNGAYGKRLFRRKDPRRQLDPPHEIAVLALLINPLDAEFLHVEHHVSPAFQFFMPRR
jgi:hypothetical protein